MSGTKPSNPKDLCGMLKVPMSVIPSGVLAEVGVGMFEGTSKYGRHNYRAVGVRSSIYYDATMRHLMDFWEGNDIDPDSGMSHITKAICSLVVWRDAQMQGKCIDDRPHRFMSEHQPLFVKPGTGVMPDAEWRVLSWNASWMAAESLDPDSRVIVVDGDTDEELASENDGALQ